MNNPQQSFSDYERVKAAAVEMLMAPPLSIPQKVADQLVVDWELNVIRNPRYGPQVMQICQSPMSAQINFWSFAQGYMAGYLFLQRETKSN